MKIDDTRLKETPMTRKTLLSMATTLVLLGSPALADDTKQQAQTTQARPEQSTAGLVGALPIPGSAPQQTIVKDAAPTPQQSQAQSSTSDLAPTPVTDVGPLPAPQQS